MPAEVTSWFDYTVSKGTTGSLSLVHFRAGNLDIWSLSVDPEGFTWHLVSTFNLVPAFAALWQNIFPGAHLANTEIE